MVIFEKNIWKFFCPRAHFSLIRCGVACSLECKQKHTRCRPTQLTPNRAHAIIDSSSSPNRTAPSSIFIKPNNWVHQL
jgi:hypothetical protein